MTTTNSAAISKTIISDAIIGSSSFAGGARRFALKPSIRTYLIFIVALALPDAQRECMYQPPFRWNIQKRSELGSLLDGPEAATYPAFLDDLLACCARILSYVDDSDLFFVGRSPESMFD